AADQPMHYRDRYTVIFNGEIYNYLELREELARSGHVFGTASDTEVILAAYAQHGEACVERFDGMFALALWDARERTLFCARDRFGEKPFYFHHHEGQEFTFASEMKALFAAGVSRRASRGRLYDFLAHDVVQDPSDGAATFYEDVRSLEPAHTVTVSAARRQSRRYWAIPPRQGAPPLGLEQAGEKLRALFLESTRRRLRSDVTLGSSLSGGLDSSTVVCALRSLGAAEGLRQRTFSARFRQPALDEGQHIEQVAQAVGLQPNYTWPDAEGLAANLDRLVAHQEEPFSTPSIYAQWEVMRLAQEHGTIVLLDGQGADEVFAGYHHFFRPLVLGLLRSDGNGWRAEVAAYEARHGRSLGVGWRLRMEARAPALLRALGRVRRHLGRGAEADWLHPGFAGPHRQRPVPFVAFRELDAALRFFTQDYGLRNLLRYADRNSMAFSREVRLPFLSHELVEFAFTLPDSFKLHQGWTKLVLREAAKGLVPESIRLRVDKIGFDTPQAEWLGAAPMRQLAAEATAALESAEILRRGVALDAGRQWRVLQARLFLRLTGELP
ncbi:MAG TPA: asparagine synthase (glutamine-hydrolyzing), partial [Vicinamibacteria bacterium]